MTFRLAKDTPDHSLETLTGLYEYGEFMESIKTMIDLGCGNGKDLLWWANAVSNDDRRAPLDIDCYGIDLNPESPFKSNTKNLTYISGDFEGSFHVPDIKYDVLWSHDSFQFCQNPFNTLIKWHNMTSDGGMLVIIVPQTTNFYQRTQQFELQSHSMFHYTLVSLIHLLAMSGWDCKAGFFLKRPDDPWLHAIVYKGTHGPRDPRKTTWYDLHDLKVLPDSADASIQKHGYLKQQDLLLPWIDRNLYMMSKQ